MDPLIIAVDAMGSDLGSKAVVKGTLMALEEYKNIQILLVGNSDEIKREIKNYNPSKSINPMILHASEVIGTYETPTIAIKQKKDSSMVVGLCAVREGKAKAFVSAGSTGALLTGAIRYFKRKPNISRPALATIIPTYKNPVLLIDSGANMDSKPMYLEQFAMLGSEYMRNCMNRMSPRVGLINVGVEKGKGNELAKETHDLLENSGLNFVGNIEASDILKGDVDVLVCDGFVGNIILKSIEGFAKTMFSMIKDELMATTKSRIGAYLAQDAFTRLKKRFDYREVGGAPFLGLESLVVKAHGSSDEIAIKNAIRQCILFENRGYLPV